MTNTAAKSYQHRDPEKVIQTQEKEKKQKYLELASNSTPFICSTDEMLGCEATTFAKRLSTKLASKWQCPYSQVCGYVNARLSIAIVRATHLCLRGSRIHVNHSSTKCPLWEDGAGLALFEC